MQDFQNRLKGTSNNFWTEDVPQSAAKNMRDSSVNKSQQLQTSTKKMVKKAKTEALAEDVEAAPKTAKNAESKKKKINYNIQDKNDDDESDAQSDSEPSEDNLDADQILKLIPKKCGKKKYLKGIEEKKKKIVEKPKELPKKPKTTLMPCMSQKKDREKSQRNASESAVKPKPAAPKLFTFKMRDNGARRDVGIQMRIVQEQKNLSLMEVDILRSTGCKWSKILYPGFKGYVKPQDKTDKFNSAEKYTNIQPLSQNMQNLNQFMHSFN